MHAIKINRAKRLSKVGKYHKTCQALLDRIPDTLIDRLTGAQLAQVLDVMHRQAQYGEDKWYNEARTINSL